MINLGFDIQDVRGFFVTCRKPIFYERKEVFQLKYLIVVSIFIGVISGCGEDQKPKAQAVAGTTATADPLAPRYDVSMAEGIDFRKEGYPNFLTAVSGMSGREVGGRWTEGAVAKFQFIQPLPKKFSLLIRTGGVIGTNNVNPIVVRIGKIQKEFIITKADETFSLDFEGGGGGDAIEIAPPKPVRPIDLDPKNPDTRLLGIVMVSMKIQ